MVALAVWIISDAAALRTAGRVVYSSFSDVRRSLETLRNGLPSDLQAAATEARWNEWAVRHDREIRSRLATGDEDTIVNWLLMGTSYTARPRAFIDLPARATPDGDASLEALSKLIATRAHDLVEAIAGAGATGDERRQFARQFFEKGGYRLGEPTERTRLEQHLLSAVVRVRTEQARYASELQEARRQNDQTEVFAARSKLYRDRGLSLDTSIQPSFALHQSLRELKSRGLLRASGLRDVAVVGPGLDFSDKSSGYDFYPQQTLQPFALVDSILRLGLSDRSAAVHLTTLDLSPRVNDHLRRAQRRAVAGSPYLLRTPFDATVPWKADFVAYWNTVGTTIGSVRETGGPNIPVGNVRVRTVAVRPDLLSRLDVEDLNVVVQRLADQKFDLVVATNVFVYYDLVDQVLALSNLASMLRPGGFLLSNNALIELPSSPLRSIGYLTTQYSDRPDDGDHVVWYRRITD
jgi:SAM-dependent methyltransferase